MPVNCGGRSPLRAYNTATLQTPMTYVVNRYCLIKNPEKNRWQLLCAPVAGLRAPSCCRCSWQPQRLSPLGPLPRRCSGFRSLPVGSPSLPSQNRGFSSQFSVVVWKQQFSRRVTSTRLCPVRRRSISLLLCRRIQPPDGALPSMQA